MDETSKLAAHVARRVAAAHPELSLDRLLAEAIAGNELTTLLLHAFRTRARRRSFANLGVPAERLEMTHASKLDARRAHAFDGAAFAAAKDFDAIELSPVEPLGAAACSGVDPNNVLATLRFAEVSGDPTTGLALHARALRKAGETGAIRLCASQRVLRLQPFDHPEFSPHFRLFALSTVVRSPRAAEDDRTERAALAEQLSVWTALFPALEAAGFARTRVSFALSDTRLVRAALARLGADADALARSVAAHKPGSADAALGDLQVPRAADDVAACAAELGLDRGALSVAAATMEELVAPLRARGVPVTFDFGRLQGLTYYRGPMVTIQITDDTRTLPIGDGGALDWMGQMLSNQRERMIATGVGTELFVKVFGEVHRLEKGPTDAALSKKRRA